MDKKFIGVRELASSMGVSEKTIYRMLNDNQLPFAVKIGGQWRFRKDGVDGWISGQTQMGSRNQSVDYTITVADALENGAVLFRIHGANRDEALDSLLTALPHNASFDHKSIKMSVLMRESLAPTSLDRIACMTATSENPVYAEKSQVILAFLEEATDFKALDGLYAQAIFLVLGANPAEQMILETRLRRLLMENAFRDEILAEPGRKELLELVGKWEGELFSGPQK